MAHAQRYLSLFVMLVLAACSDPVETLKKGEECDECKIENADFSGHKFIQKDLANIKFKNSNFEGADFSGVQLTRVWFENSNLRGAIFDNARFDRGSFRLSDLSNASFKKARLRYVFVGSSFINADFSGARGHLMFDYVYRTSKSDVGKYEKVRNDFRGANFNEAKVSFSVSKGKNILELKTISNADKIKNPEGLFYSELKGSLPSGLEKKLRDAAGRAYDRNCAKSSYGC